MSDGPKESGIATTSNTFLNHLLYPRFFSPKVIIMKNPRRTPQCCILQKVSNLLTHMYYIYFNKNLYIETIKEKTKCDFVGTTHTTLLKSAPPVTNLLYPLCFSMGTTWVQQHTTFLFRHTTFDLLVLFTALYNLLFVVCNFMFAQIRKTTNNG